MNCCPPLYFLNFLSAVGEVSLDDLVPDNEGECWWNLIRKHLVLIPGSQVELTHNAPPYLRDLMSSRVFQALCRDKLEIEEGVNIVFDNGVDRSLVGVLHDYIALRYDGSVDNLKAAGVRLPNDEYEQALRISFENNEAAQNYIDFLRWPPPRTDGNELSLPITPLTASIAGAICEELGPEALIEFLNGDYSSIGRPEPLLFEFYSRRTHLMSSPAQRATVFAILAVGVRLRNGAASRPQNPELRGLPAELWLCVLSHIRLDELGSFL